MKFNGKSLALASATALLFCNMSWASYQNQISPTTSSSTTDKSIRCMGINACKGQSACKSAGNACKGQNACKGKGWLRVDTEKECLDKGGTILKSTD